MAFHFPHAPSNEANDRSPESRKRQRGRSRSRGAVQLSTVITVGVLGIVLLAPAAVAASRRTTKKTRATVSVATKPAAAKPVTQKPTPKATVKPAQTQAQTPAAPTPQAAAKPVRTCRPVKIMPLGDSLTAFGDSYRGPLYRDLVASGLNIDFVGSLKWDPTGGGDPDGEGHGGFTIGPDENGPPGARNNLYENLDKWLPDATPDVILLTIGTNDMAASEQMGDLAPGKMTALIEKITQVAPYAYLAVGDIPLNIYDKNAPERFAAVGAAAKRYADRDPNDKVYYVPTNQRLRAQNFDLTVDLNDGVHFNPVGAQKFANVWKPTLNEILPRVGPVGC